MTYAIDFNDSKFYTELKFLPSVDNKQILFVHIINGTVSINQTVSIGSVYYFTNVSRKALPYFDVLDNTLFSMGYYATTPKYLDIGASWYDIYIGFLHEHLRVRQYAKYSFPFGTDNAYVVSYKEINHENKFWVVDNLPLPVKAQIYNVNGTLTYSYELVSLKTTSADHKLHETRNH